MADYLVPESLTGTITYELYSDESCSTTIWSDTVGVSSVEGGGYGSAEVGTPPLPTSGAFATATYSGDSNFDSSSTPCTEVAVETVPDTTQLTLDTVSFTLGVPSTVSAVLTDTTDGTPLVSQSVVVTLNNDQTCTGVTGSTGAVSCSITPQAPNDLPGSSYSLSARFAGDASLDPAFVDTEANVLQPTSLTLSADPGSSGTPTDLEAALAPDPIVSAYPPAPTGTLTFELFGDSTCSSSPTWSTAESESGSETTGSPATPTYDLSANTEALSTGTFYGVVESSGDSYWAPATSPCTAFTVNPISADLAFPGEVAVTQGAPANLSAVLTDSSTSTPLASQSVDFTLGNGSSAQTCSGTTDSVGEANCTIASVALPAGTYPLSASFAGGSQFAPAAAKTEVSVTSPASSVILGPPDVQAPPVVLSPPATYLPTAPFAVVALAPVMASSPSPAPQTSPTASAPDLQAAASAPAHHQVSKPHTAKRSCVTTACAPPACSSSQSQTAAWLFGLGALLALLTGLFLGKAWRRRRPELRRVLSRLEILGVGAAGILILAVLVLVPALIPASVAGQCSPHIATWAWAGALALPLVLLSAIGVLLGTQTRRVSDDESQGLAK